MNIVTGATGTIGSQLVGEFLELLSWKEAAEKLGTGLVLGVLPRACIYPRTSMERCPGSGNPTFCDDFLMSKNID